MDSAWLADFLSQPEFQGMGHGQSIRDYNLGMGWIYYGLARAFRPRHVVCIGSYRGFAPILFARAQRDNGDDSGLVTFIDPSFVDDFWRDNLSVQSHFNRYGAPNITHHCLTTQEFKVSEHYDKLSQVDFLFVDGYHTAEQAKFDHLSFVPKLSKDHVVFFHDSVSRSESKIYGLENKYTYSVVEYIDEIKLSGNYQVLDLNIENGLTVVKSIN